MERSAHKLELLRRIEELEKAVSRLKFGVAAKEEPANAHNEPQTSAPPSAPSHQSDVQTGVAENAASEAVEARESVPYAKWGRVLANIEISKPAIYTASKKALALVNADGSFTVKYDKVWHGIIVKQSENTVFIRGLIAECENKSADEIRLTLTVKEPGDASSFSVADELEDALK